MLHDTALSAILAGYVVTPTEAGKFLRTGESSLLRAIKAGEIPHFRIGNNIKIPTSWLRAQLQITEAA